MRRSLTLAIMLTAALLPAAVSHSQNSAPSARIQVPVPVVAPAAAQDQYGRTWLVVSAGRGLLVSRDNGAHWTAATGLPSRGSFYTIVADVARTGTAFAANGDVYATEDGGSHWLQLPPAPGSLGPAGITTLASDPRLDLIYAGATRILAYRSGRRAWTVWGRGWPAGARPTALLPVVDQGLYATPATGLYHTTGQKARWQRLATEAWGNAPITALSLGPDGVTPYVAVLGSGVWYVDSHQAVHQVSGTPLPRDLRVSALQSDPRGDDLYAATNRGVYVRHQNATADVVSHGNRWLPVAGIGPVEIAALRPQRQGLLAVGANGALYLGTGSRQGQGLRWRPWNRRVPTGNTPIMGALAGAEWEAQLPSPLPAQFTQNCLRFGYTDAQAFDVCGPFRDFYLHFGPKVFGYPIELATVASHGSVRQSFDNVVLEWTPQRGVYLAPLGQMALRGRVFPHPSATQLQQVNTPIVNGYYVEPLFYAYWHEHLWHGVSIFGAPISQGLRAPSTDGTGRIVQVQYFTNSRLEWHQGYQPGAQIRLSPLQSYPVGD